METATQIAAGSSADRRANGRAKAAARSRLPASRRVGKATGPNGPVEKRTGKDGKALLRSARSRITNGSALVLGDNRSAWVRRCKDIIALHIGDLGGVENVSNAELSLIRRAAALTTELEMLEAIFANAGRATPTELDLYSRTAGNLRRLLETLGIKRRPKDVTPTVDEYLQTKHGVAV